MSEPCLLIVEADMLVRTPLADYLRDCGYQVLEAVDAAEARQLLAADTRSIDIVLADVGQAGADGFTLATWIRTEHPDVRLVLAGSVVRATEQASGLCEEGPALTTPYDHRHVLEHIRRLRAARDRGS
jgi:DNA-binding response OmpR family regulator